MPELTLSPPTEQEIVAPSGVARVVTDKLSAMYGSFTAVKDVSLSFSPNRVHALIGPSGCGKSTFLRTLNRMHEVIEGGWISGKVLLDGEDIYAPKVNVMQLRRRVGMV
ncbi:MAG TPA: ATP-binding cassette domain-containing protein, partial [Gemmatimonadales bacterium]|nr:ATP-binding cassette domain-containing protein [Gemmatimonadales bacterium]